MVIPNTKRRCNGKLPDTIHVFAFLIIFFFAKKKHEKQKKQKKQKHVKRGTDIYNEVKKFVYSENLSEGGEALEDIMPDVVRK